MAISPDYRIQNTIILNLSITILLERSGRLGVVAIPVEVILHMVSIPCQGTQNYIIPSHFPPQILIAHTDIVVDFVPYFSTQMVIIPYQILDDMTSDSTADWLGS